MKFGELQEETSKASLPVRADLSDDFKSIILETDQRKLSPFVRLSWEEQQKYLQYLQYSQNNATYRSIMNADTDATYQTVNLFSSDKCFIYFISDAPHTLARHCLYNSGKGKYTRYIWSNHVFIL